MSFVKFWRGKDASLGAISAKDANTIYFVTDAGKIMLGDSLVATASSAEVESLAAKVAKHEAILKGLESTTVTAYITGIVGSATLTTTDKTLKGAINEVKSVADATKAKVDHSTTGLATKVATTTYNAKMTQLDSSIKNSDASIDTLQSQYSTLNGTVANKLDTATYNSERGAAVSTLHTAAKNVVGSLNELHNDISTNISNISSLGNRVTSVESAVGAVNSAFVFKGEMTSTAPVRTTVVSKGHAYIGSGATFVVGTKNIEAGDMLVITSDTPKAISALTAADILVVEKNIDNAISKSGSAGAESDLIAVKKTDNTIAYLNVSVGGLKTLISNAQAKADSAHTLATGKLSRTDLNASLGALGVNTVKEYVDASITSANSFATTKANQALTDAKAYTNASIGAIAVSTVKIYVDNAKSAAISSATSTAAADAASKVKTLRDEVVPSLTWNE